MTTHELKIAPAYFEPVAEGRKTFEVRSIEDRAFAVGDTLRLLEWSAVDGYSGRQCERTITYILAGTHYCAPGYAILGLYPSASLAEHARLRAENEALKQNAGTYWPRILELKAEVERLRALLTEDLPHIFEGQCPDPTQPDARDTDCAACRLLIAADAALASRTQEGA